MDIKPRLPRRPQASPATPRPVATQPISPRPTVTVAEAPFVPVDAPLPLSEKPDGIKIKKDYKKLKKTLLFSLIGLFGLVLLLVLGGWIWYQVQLSPAGSDKSELIKVSIKSGTAPGAIGELLEKEGIIRNQQAFSIYTRLTGTQNKLQAGGYRLSPGESTPEIVKHLTDGTVDTFSIRFLPGATLAENRKVLLNAGYSEEEVDAGLTGAYTSFLFDTKPAGDLEGFIYGETYNFSSSATVEDILQRTFDQFEKVIAENDLIAKYQARGLTLFQGITLASIIQREAIKGDEPQIAQVFYSRLASGMPLGSDVTYQYIADKTGVDRDPNLDSPYNTRRYTGLPPGPIASPGIRSLKAVADPAPGDYLFFLSGDDDVTYYARTLKEHEANISAHCKIKCSIL